ncbi:MAG TPA: hypothetical protein VG939_11440 [Caulobacteraceae bacterium]|nr:hypothetical protein [Caulobacteraceae bacterium]
MVDVKVKGEAEADQENVPQARLAARLTTKFLLRSLKLVSDLHDGEMLTAIIASAIVDANTALIDSNLQPGGPYADLADPPPNEARRPVSVLAVADSLGLPFETVRRHVNRLIAAGWCVRVKGGVVMTTEALLNPRNTAAVLANLRYLRRFLRELKRAGFSME